MGKTVSQMGSEKHLPVEVQSIHLEQAYLQPLKPFFTEHSEVDQHKREVLLEMAQIHSVSLHPK